MSKVFSAPAFTSSKLTTRVCPWLRPSLAIVREKLLQFTHAEIPFSSAVVIDRFEEPTAERALLRLFCTIVVDRESQKPIVVGRGGDMIKRIGTAAREELERFFATRVYLDLHVRVKSEWREDDGVLNEIGLGDRK